MDVCPTCGSTFEVSGGFCPHDGARLVVSPSRKVGGAASGAAATWNPAPPSVQETAAGTQGPEHAKTRPPSAAEVVTPRYEEDGEERLIGELLAERYRVEASIGAGGMGVVYKAVHIAIDKPVAIKVLRSEYAGTEEVAKRFELEARIASKLSHPNVVDISDYGYTPGGSPYYVMELLEGTTLSDLIDSGPPVELERAIDIAQQVASGLAIAHRNGVIHRDLKPDNIILVESGKGEVAKILDFGIARVEQKRTRLTAAGSVVGTPEYMSPEQAQGKDVDARADLYSLAVIMFEMLSGGVPLRGATMVETLTKQVYEAPPRLSQIVNAYAQRPDIDDFIAAGLSKDVDVRPQSAEAFIDGLGRLQSKGGAAGQAGSAAADDMVKATVAMGSWSVGDAGYAEAMASLSTDSQRGPVFNQGAPKPMGFGNTPVPVAPVAAAPQVGVEPAAASVAAVAAVPAIAAAPAAAPAMQGSGLTPGYGPQHGTPPPGYGYRGTQAPRRAKATNWPLVIVVSLFGTVGVALGVVALFRVLDAPGSAAEPVASEEGNVAAKQNAESPTSPTVGDSDVPDEAGGAVIAPVDPTENVDASSTNADGPGEPEPGASDSGPPSATGGAGAGSAVAIPEPKKSTSKRKKVKKARPASTAPTGSTKGSGDGSSSTTTGGGGKASAGTGVPDAKDPPPETKPPKDPPVDPGVSLGDLRDPFG